MRVLAYLAFLVVMFAVHGALAPVYVEPLGRLLIVICLSFVATLVHELGHAGAAWAVGAEVLSIAVLPFELRLRPAKLRFASRSARNREVGGYVTYSLDRIDARRKHMIVAFAGPAANLVLAGAVLLLPMLLYPQLPAADVAVQIGSPPFTGGGPELPSQDKIDAYVNQWRPERAVKALAMALAVLSAGAGLVNLIPFKGSDGNAIVSQFRARRR